LTYFLVLAVLVMLFFPESGDIRICDLVALAAMREYRAVA
jgi:hypothetical protein